MNIHAFLYPNLKKNKYSKNTINVLWIFKTRFLDSLNDPQAIKQHLRPIKDEPKIKTKKKMSKSSDLWILIIIIPQMIFGNQN